MKLGEFKSNLGWICLVLSMFIIMATVLEEALAKTGTDISAGELIRKCSRRASIRKRIVVGTYLSFIVPLVLLILAASPIIASPSPTKDLTSYLLTLWQVHAAVAGAAIVLFVFLLQTANIGRRNAGPVFVLAHKSGILRASAFGLSSTLGLGVVIAMISSGISAGTWPVLATMIFATVLNVAIVLGVMLKAIQFLGRIELWTIQTEMWLDEVVSTTYREILGLLASSHIMAKIDGTPIRSRWHFMIRRDGEVEPAWRWSLRRRAGTVVDMDLNALHQSAKTHGEIQLLVHPGESLDKPGRIVEFSFRPGWRLRLKLSRSVRHIRDAGSDTDGLSELLEEVVNSVRDGNVVRFKEGLALGTKIIKKCLMIIDELGAVEAVQAGDLTAMRVVCRMFRYAMEEALKTGRADFAIAVRDAVPNLADEAIAARNASALELILDMYPFLRRVVLETGLQSDPLYSEIYWRTLTELRFSLQGSATTVATFDERARGLIERALVLMMKDCIHDQAQDFEVLLDAHRRAFQYDEVARRRSSRRGTTSVYPEGDGSVWVILAGWVHYLLSIGRVDAKFSQTVLRRIASQFADPEDLFSATVRATNREDADQSELSSWILWTKAEGIAHGIDSRSPVIASALAMYLFRWASLSDSPSASSTAETPGGQINIRSSARQINIGVVDRAYEIADTLTTVVNQVCESESQVGKVFASVGLEPQEVRECLTAVQVSFEKASKHQKDLERAELRAAQLDPTKVVAFEDAFVTAVVDVSLFKCYPRVFEISSDPLVEDPHALGSGVYTRLPKQMFTSPSNWTGQDQTARDLAYSVAESEVNRLLEVITTVAKAEVVPLESVLDRLAELCSEEEDGIVFIRGSGVRLGLHRHPAFAYGSDRYRGQQGTLHGKPIIMVFETDSFAGVFLPASSVSVKQAAYGPDQRPALARVEFVEENIAKQILEAQTANSGENLRNHEREEALVKLQESVLFKGMVRSEIDVRSAVVLRASEPADDEL